MGLFCHFEAFSPYPHSLFCYTEKSGQDIHQKEIFCVPRKKESWLNNDIFGFNFPTGICKVPQSISAPLLVLVSVWEVDCVFRHTHTHTRIHTHIRRVYVGLWDETLFICARPLLFCFFWHKPSPFSTLYLYLSLSHTHSSSCFCVL